MDTNTSSTGAGSSSGSVECENKTVERTITVNRPVDELYRFWRQFGNFPLFMEHIKSVTKLNEERYHFVHKAPGDSVEEWDAIIIDDIPEELISWRSVDSEIPQPRHCGSVRFRPAPGNQGTELRVVLTYRFPVGRITKYFDFFFRDEAQRQLRADLRCFKALMETGEIPTIEGQSSGRTAHREKNMKARGRPQQMEAPVAQEGRMS